MIAHREPPFDAELDFSIARGSLLPAAWESAPTALTLAANDCGTEPRDPRPETSLYDAVARHAAHAPDAIAVVSGDQAVRYDALLARVDHLTQFLLTRGVGRESPVAVCLAPSVDTLVAILAILRAGGVYVPLDPSYPSALLADILQEVVPTVVLTDAASRASLPETAPLVQVDRDDLALPPGWVARPCPAVERAQAAYVFYTSGTTGRPKGVVASHQNLAHYLRVAQRRFRFRRDDVFCSLARHTFSISLFELLLPLAVGARVVMVQRDAVLDPARLVRVLDQVTVVHAGPSLLGSLFRHLQKTSGSARPFARMRHASSGGDLVPPRVVEEMKRFFPAAELYVVYGCTEISCMGTSHEVDRATTATRTLVGKPFGDVTMRLLDERGQVVSRGEVGEVYFAGEGVARRYLRRPALTSERFLSIDGQRFYRTGDLGRVDEEGRLELLGRSDFQVQVRGMRIELPGIEHTVVARGLATQCAVVAARRDEDVRLVAFVVADEQPDPGAFRRTLAEALPDYMLPQTVIALPAMPVTPNGKLDRRRLIELAETTAPTSLRTGARAPLEGALEHAIAAAFTRVLGVDDVGPHDDFFALGGHSLSAVLLLTEIQNVLGLSLSPTRLFANSSVRALAEAANAEPSTEQKPILLSSDADKPALFMLLGVHLYRALAAELASRYAVYGVFSPRELGLLEANGQVGRIEELARDYVTIIRRAQPRGPYRLGGMSFGGIVAYEVAQQLEAAGETVEELVMIDALLPERFSTKLRRFASLPLGEKLASLSQRAQNRFRARHETTLSTPATDAKLAALDDQRQAAYRAAAAAYARGMTAYAGPATLIVAGERLRGDALADPSCGFRAHAPQLAQVRVEASHLGLLEAPHVGKVAEAIGRDRVDVGPSDPTAHASVATLASPIAV